MKIKDRHEAPPHMDGIKKYLNTDQLAELLGVSPRTIKECLNTPQLVELLGVSPRTLEGYLNTPQLAELLGVSPRTLEEWRATGLGPPFCRMGGRLVIYRPQDVDEWLISRRTSSTSQEQEQAAT